MDPIRAQKVEVYCDVNDLTSWSVTQNLWGLRTRKGDSF